VIVLYHGGGASDFSLLDDRRTTEQTRTLLETSARLLKARGHDRAAQLLGSVDFRVWDAANHFNDEFCVLYAVLPLDRYEDFRKCSGSETDSQAFGEIAAIFAELNVHVRFIAVELALERVIPPEAKSDRALTTKEINKVVYKYIGVNGGYLGDFSYRSHQEFYIDLDLDINPYDYDGTTRERFIKILTASAPAVQALILAGVLKKYPVGSSATRTKDVHDEIEKIAARLRGTTPVEEPDLRITSVIVERALVDAQKLIQASGATSGVDRAHTALQGFMRAACSAAGLETNPDASVTELFKVIRERHPAFAERGPRAEDIKKIQRALASILDALDPLRNRASVAHPNDAILAEPEAMLVVNSIRTLLHFLDEKIHRYEKSATNERQLGRTDDAGK
jgi:hypothetical protein